MNKYRNNVIIYAEDGARKGATVQLAEAWFAVRKSSIFNRGKVSIKSCNGWMDARDKAIANAQLNTSKGTDRCIVILIDFDRADARLQEIKNAIAQAVPDYADRFYIVGWSGNIESLKAEANCAGKGFDRLAEKLVDDYQSGCLGLRDSDAFRQMRESGECQRLQKDILPLIESEP